MSVLEVKKKEKKMFKNDVPYGFNPVEIPKADISQVEWSKYGSEVLEGIFTGFTEELSIIPPLVLAKSNNVEDGKSSQFNFRGCFAIRSSVNVINGFNILMKESWTGTSFTPEFLLDINCVEGTVKDPFKVFVINFKMYFSVAPKSITTYVWNQDPEGSRGTETVVQSGTGG